MNSHETIENTNSHRHPSRKFLYVCSAIILTLVGILCLRSGFFLEERTYTREQDNYQVFGITNDYWTIEMVHGLGGKIISLQDNISGREWLWSRNTARSLYRPGDEDVFGEGNLIGWDEIFPNLQETAWQQTKLKGHGTLWRADIESDEKAWRNGFLHSQMVCEEISIRYEREIRLKDRTVEVRYRVENYGDQPFPYMWALHPLFNIQTGDVLSADLATESFRVEAAPGIPQLKKGDLATWPGKDHGINLENLFLGDTPQAGIKLYIHSPKDDRVSIQNAETGAGFTIRYNKEALPYLAIWLSRGVWGNAHHLVIEPTNRSNETLSDSNPHEDPSGWLKPGEVREWKLSIENDSRSPEL